jgi:hypothetical protein
MVTKAPFHNQEDFIQTQLLPHIAVRLQERNTVGEMTHSLAQEVSKDGPLYVTAKEGDMRTNHDFLEACFFKNPKTSCYQVYLLFEEDVNDSSEEVEDLIPPQKENHTRRKIGNKEVKEKREAYARGRPKKKCIKKEETAKSMPIQPKKKEEPEVRTIHKRTVSQISISPDQFRRTTRSRTALDPLLLDLGDPDEDEDEDEA